MTCILPQQKGRLCAIHFTPKYGHMSLRFKSQHTTVHFSRHVRLLTMLSCIYADNALRMQMLTTDVAKTSSNALLTRQMHLHNSHLTFTRVMRFADTTDVQSNVRATISRFEQTHMNVTTHALEKKCTSERMRLDMCPHAKAFATARSETHMVRMRVQDTCLLNLGNGADPFPLLALWPRPSGRPRS